MPRVREYEKPWTVNRYSPALYGISYRTGTDIDYFRWDPAEQQGSEQFKIFLRRNSRISYPCGRIFIRSVSLAGRFVPGRQSRIFANVSGYVPGISACRYATNVRISGKFNGDSPIARNSHGPCRRGISPLSGLRRNACCSYCYAWKARNTRDWRYSEIDSDGLLFGLCQACPRKGYSAHCCYLELNTVSVGKGKSKVCL